MSGGFSSGVSWRALFRGLMFSLVYANGIGTVMALAMPSVGRWAWRRPFPLNWTLLLGSLLILTAAGTLIANVLLMSAGLISPPAFWRNFLGSFQVAAVVSLVIGSGVTVYELIRSDLEQTTVALRTKERDEAEARRLASEAQLASLESRVQPHFLFNTLNSIAALIPRDPEGAERMTGQLASLMRSSLDHAGTSLVPLEQELKIVRDYLDIERVRFGGRLRFQMDTDGLPGSVMVPRLSLQTLVENSVKFAVSPRREGATVTIRAKRAGSSILLEVEDDGPGFDAVSAHENHGLALLKARLALTFGDRARLSIDTRAGRTSVVIELPGDTASA
jgi:sensor histidine kinase YesM